MKESIIKIDDFDFDKLKLGVELKKSDEWMLFKLKYSNLKPFYIQTKRCIIPYGKNDFPSFYIKLDDIHLRFIRALERRIRKLMNTNCSLPKSKFRSRINDSSEYDLYRIDYTPSVIKVYDEYKNETSMLDIVSGTFAVFMIDINYIWINSVLDEVKNFGYKVEVVQMRIFNYINLRPVFDRCMIENEGQENPSDGFQAIPKNPPLPPPPPPKLLAPKPLVIKRGGVNSLVKAKEKKPHDKLIDELKKRFKEEQM